VAAPVVTPFELHYKCTTYFSDMQRFLQKLLKKNYNSIPVHKNRHLRAYPVAESPLKGSKRLA
jgi:hypothetical protein